MLLLNTAHSLFVLPAHWKLFGGVNTNFRKLLLIRFALAVFFLKVTYNIAGWIHGVPCISLLLTVLFICCLIAFDANTRLAVKPFSDFSRHLHFFMDEVQ